MATYSERDRINEQNERIIKPLLVGTFLLGTGLSIGLALSSSIDPVIVLLLGYGPVVLLFCLLIPVLATLGVITPLPDE